MNNTQAHKTKKNRVQQTNASLNVKLVMRIIPPAGVKSLFHNPADKIFHSRAQNHRGKKEWQPG